MTPVFEGAIEGYVANFLKKNYWKVQRSLTYDDAWQEARLVFWELVRYYEGKIDSPAWFMSLYKTSLARKWVDLAASDTKVKQTLSHTTAPGDDGEVLDIIETLVGDQSNLGEFFTLVRQAPDDVKEVLSVLFNTPAELLDLAAQSWRREGRTKEFGNAMLCRMLGKDPSKVDVVAAMRKHFTS